MNAEQSALIRRGRREEPGDPDYWHRIDLAVQKALARKAPMDAVEAEAAMPGMARLLSG